MDKIKKGVRLDHISKIYQDPKTGKDFYAVKDTSLTIEPGSFVTLLGPSGCGKTTTLRMIAGFESPDEGEIYLGDEPINALTPNKRDTAMVFQSYALLPHYNVFDNVAYGLKLRKVPKDEIRERVMHILDLVELTGMEGRMTNQLSGGQQQRVALARALVIAALEPRRQAARFHAHRDPPHPAGGRHHRHLRHARPERGHGALGPDHHYEQGRRCPDWHAAGDLLSPRERVRRRLHRRGELPARQNDRHGERSGCAGRRGRASGRRPARGDARRRGVHRRAASRVRGALRRGRAALHH